MKFTATTAIFACAAASFVCVQAEDPCSVPGIQLYATYGNCGDDAGGVDKLCRECRDQMDGKSGPASGPAPAPAPTSGPAPQPSSNTPTTTQSSSAPEQNSTAPATTQSSSDTTSEEPTTTPGGNGAVTMSISFGIAASAALMATQLL